MAPEISPFRKPKSATPDFWRSLVAAVVAIAVGWGGVVYAANNSVQGAKKEEGGFDGDAPTAILIEASSGSRSEEHTSELQSLRHLVCRLLLEKKNIQRKTAKQLTMHKTPRR